MPLLKAMAVVSAIACVATVGWARAAGELSTAETEAFDNYHYEMVECVSYFGALIEGLKRRGEKKIAAHYKKAMDILVGRMYEVGKRLGMKYETNLARLRLMTRKHSQEMGSDFINFSILMEKYNERCQTVVEKPAERIRFWMIEAAKEP